MSFGDGVGVDGRVTSKVRAVDDFVSSGLPSLFTEGLGWEEVPRRGL